jgi:hypothetical protein
MSSACREKQVRVMCHGRVMVRYAIQLGAVTPHGILLFLTVLILLILRDSGVCESRPARLHSSNQIRNGASLTAQNLPEMPDRNETVVLNLCKPN